MKNVLISFLGLAQNNYAETEYQLSDGTKLRKNRYISVALQEHIRPDLLLLVGTTSSMWGMFLYEHGELSENLEEQWLHIDEASKQGQVTPELLHPFQDYLSQKLNCEVRCLLINHKCITQEEQIDLLEILNNQISVNNRVTLDVTHSFRHIPMLALLASRLLEIRKKAKIEHIYYGAYDRDNLINPVIDLAGLLDMFKWGTALDQFDDSGNYAAFAKLLPQDIDNFEKIKKGLTDTAFYERTSNVKFANKSNPYNLLNKAESSDYLFQLFKPDLLARLKWQEMDTFYKRELALAIDYFDRKDYLRTIIYLFEGQISKQLYLNKLPDNQGNRDHIKNKLTNKYFDFKILTYLRNNIAHGNRDNSDNKEISNNQIDKYLDLLSDEAQMHSFLKNLLTKKFEITIAL